MSVTRQVICTVILCWIRMSFCMTFSWPSFTEAAFTSDGTPLLRAMTVTEATLLGSLLPAGAALGTPAAAALLNTLGRKRSIILTALIHVLAWAVIAVTERVELVLASMFAAGVGCAAFVVIPVYIGEVCQPSVRGAMAALMAVACGLGLLGSYLGGGLLPYKPMCYVCLSVAALGLLMTAALKESPVFLMKKGREEEAAESIAFYRNTRRDSKTVIEEIAMIRRTLNPQEDQTEEEEKLKPDPESVKVKEKVSLFQFIKNSKSTRRAAVLSVTLMSCSLLQGYAAVCVHAEPLLRQAAPGLAPVLCSALLALATVAASLASASLVDVVGRRPLMVYSCVGSGVCCALLGAQLQRGAGAWAPLAAAAACCFCFCYSLGAGAVPYVLAAELFLPEVSGVMSTVVYELGWLSTCALLAAYGPLARALGLGGLCYVFAGVCFFTAAYAARRLPETKGLTTEDIQKLLLKDD